VYQPDCNNQFPLHIAVENAASTDVQSYLINQNSFAAKVPDIHGRTPLHLVFHDYNVRRKRDPDQNLKRTLFDAVRLLSDAAPMSVFVQDRSGKTALECAVSERVELKIRKEIEKVASRIGSNNGILEVKKRKIFETHIDKVLAKVRPWGDVSCKH